MEREFVYFDTENSANAFLIDCLSVGIYCRRIYNMGLMGVEIDVERTCKEKNEVSYCKNKG